MASTPSTMRALVSNLPNTSQPVLEISSKPVPNPANGEVLIKVYASGLNASDAANALYNRFRRTVPLTMGRDFAGEVVAAPASPSLVGQRVFGSSGNVLSFKRDGTMADFLCVPADGVARVPAAARFAQAAALGTPFTTAWVALAKAQLAERREGETVQVVLVLGASGAVGTAAAHLAKARGHVVITTSRRDGADINIATDPTLQGVASVTNGKGVDVVIDCVGEPNLTGAALEVLGRGGRLAVVTAKGPNGNQINLRQLYTRDQTIVGVFSGGLSLAENQAALQVVADFIDQGKITLEDESKLTLVKFDDAVETYPKCHAFDGTKYVFEWP